MDLSTLYELENPQGLNGPNVILSHTVLRQFEEFSVLYWVLLFQLYIPFKFWQQEFGFGCATS